MTEYRWEHVGLAVRDLDRAAAWYCRAFALTRTFAFRVDGARLAGVILESEEGWRIELLSRVGSTPGLRAGSPIEAALTEGYGHIALRVADLDAAYRSLTYHGARIVVPPGPSPEGGIRMGWVSDPDGNLIELIEKPLPDKESR